MIIPTIKGASLILICYYLYSKLSASVLEDFEFNRDIQLALPVLLILCMLNWSLEAFKWQTLTKSVCRTSFPDSIKGVLSGLSLSMIVPMGLGDKIGRLGYIRTFKKLETISLGYLGGFIQFIITSIFGLYGIFHLIELGWSIQPWPFMVGVLAFSVLLTFVLGLIRFFLSDTAFSKFLSRILKSLNEISFRDFALFILLSVLRYAVFALQLFILFHLMDLGLSSLTLMAGVTWIFFSKTVIPAFNFLSDLGVREFSAVFFFSFYQVSAHDIILPTLLLWLINIFLPSLFGMYFIAKIRLSTETSI